MPWPYRRFTSKCKCLKREWETTKLYFLCPKFQQNPFFIGSGVNTLNFIIESFDEVIIQKNRHRRKKIDHQFQFEIGFSGHYFRCPYCFSSLPWKVQTKLVSTRCLNTTLSKRKVKAIVYILESLITVLPQPALCESLPLLPLFSPWDTPRIPYQWLFVSGTVDTERIRWSPVDNSTTVKRQPSLLYLMFAI